MPRFKAVVTKPKLHILMCSGRALAVETSTEGGPNNCGIHSACVHGALMQ